MNSSSASNKKKNVSIKLWDPARIESWPLNFVTDDILDQWEMINKVKIPVELRDLYKNKNGGYLNRKFFKELDLFPGISLVESRHSLRSVAEIEKHVKETDYDGYFRCGLIWSDLFILSGDGHVYFLVDFSCGGFKVLRIDIEIGISVQTIYSNFNDFSACKAARKKVVSIWDRIGVFIENSELFEISVKISNARDLFSKVSEYFNFSEKSRVDLDLYLKLRLKDKNLTKLSSFEASLWLDVLTNLSIDFSLKDGSLIDSSWWSHFFYGRIDSPSKSEALIFLLDKFHVSQSDIERMSAELKSGFYTGKKDKKLSLGTIEFYASMIKDYDKLPVPNCAVYNWIHESYKTIETNVIRYE